MLLQVQINQDLVDASLERRVADRGQVCIWEQITDDIDRELEQVSIKDWFFIAAVAVLAANIYIVYGKYRIVI